MHADIRQQWATTQELALIALYEDGELHEFNVRADSCTGWLIPYYRGVCYLYGHGVLKDVSRANELFQTILEPLVAAVEGGNALAMTVLGSLYATGNSVPKDIDKAIDYWRMGADKGCGYAQMRLALAYENGLGVTIDKVSAAKWYERAAVQGVRKAQYKLAKILLSGDGVPKNLDHAMAWLIKSASYGYALSQFDLGCEYHHGVNIEKDDVLAVLWWKRAAERGYFKAQTMLGISLEEGIGVAIDERQAVDWYRKAAEQGGAMAQHRLGVMYQNGKGVEKDYGLAFKWYGKSAEREFGPAQYALACAYATGDGIGCDEGLALVWCRKAITNGCDEAKKLLDFLEKSAERTVERKSLEKERDEMLVVISTSAEAGNATDQLFLAKAYLDGVGIEKNLELARKWYFRAAEQEHGVDRQELELIGKLLRAEEKLSALESVAQDHERLFMAVKAKAESGDAVSQRKLGHFYEIGYTVGKDIATARKWYLRAAELGDEVACMLLLKLNGANRNH